MAQTEPIYGVFSPGVAFKAKRIERFLNGEVHLRYAPVSLANARSWDGLAGWGRKGLARWAADHLQRPYLGLEDGFLGAAEGAFPSFCLTADATGVYYVASKPSALERLIEDWRTIPAETLREADRLMALMRAHNLGKYNNGRDLNAEDLAALPEKPVIVVDQIPGDRSIGGGGCSAKVFSDMLQAALTENQRERVVVRLHPQRGKNGARPDHLRDLAVSAGVRVMDAPVSWMSLANIAAKVYVATSQAGLEALIAGVPVSCFGQPFYSGYGLTDDRGGPIARRTARPPLNALIAATYIQYSRYLSPIDDQACSATELARLIATRRRRDTQTEGSTHVVGVHLWKRYSIAPFVSGARSRTTWSMSAQTAVQRQKKLGGRVAVWSSRSRDLALLRAHAAEPILQIEDGFLRSVGLGAELTPPLSLAVDEVGVYYDPARPSALENVLNDIDMDFDLRRRSVTLRRGIVEAGLSKYNTGGLGAIALTEPYDRLRILVPGQVSDDASVLNGSGLKDMLPLLSEVRRRRPDAFIIYKPHPDVVAGRRSGAIVASEALKYADAVQTDCDIATLIDWCEEVHTITSLTGFEALMREKRVFTYGMPFYAGWGLTDDRIACSRRNRRLCLDELVAAALILYPRYSAGPYRWPCWPEDVAALIGSEKSAPKKASISRTQRLMIGLARSSGMFLVRD